MSPSDRLPRIAIGLAESGAVPDRLVRFGMRRVVHSRLRAERHRDPAERGRFWEMAWEGPIAIHPDRANEQHYEVPPEFFELVLGPARKYSCAYWASDTSDLEDAEEAMFQLYADRAALGDGQTILDLGCGWGSFTLWAAGRFPDSKIVAMSNSGPQTTYIRQEASDRGLSNVETITADINSFSPARPVDRIVSIEMIEHVRNHRALFERIAEWLDPDGLLFTHVFAHRDLSYPFETEGAANWMARTFFTGGTMPSHDLLADAAEPRFETAGDWWVVGSHYSCTLEAWLQRLDANRVEVRDVLEPVYGDDVDIWIQRWRMFFMACSEMFGFAGGHEWGVSHRLFRSKGSRLRPPGSSSRSRTGVDTGRPAS